MKKENQNLQQGTGSTENKDESHRQQSTKTTNDSNNQQSGIPLQAGLGRDRMTDIEDPDSMSGRDDQAIGNRDE